ncbi:MAG: hypothetical protein MJE68_02435 [Proteobacteria bacterium]|nr:hypothetical protein [Pseudomonadota bacterium]
MLSATKNATVVEDYLRKECALGRVLGRFKRGSLNVHINRFGVIPKPHQPGKWRLIVDLSDPSGGSVNDGVDPILCSLAYKTMDDAMTIILHKGKDTLLANLTWRVHIAFYQSTQTIDPSWGWNGKIKFMSMQPSPLGYDRLRRSSMPWLTA